jgi:hypothetical protein
VRFDPGSLKRKSKNTERSVQKTVFQIGGAIWLEALFLTLRLPPDLSAILSAPPPPPALHCKNPGLGDFPLLIIPASCAIRWRICFCKFAILAGWAVIVTRAFAGDRMCQRKRKRHTERMALHNSLNIDQCIV